MYPGFGHLLLIRSSTLIYPHILMGTIYFSVEKCIRRFKLLGAAQNLSERLTVNANHMRVCSHCGGRLP